ncbi:hypothetical protein [Pseudomonas sp. NFR16]|uniref:hypothetical protein n=1 Tax=Pseudomonas sp. NFR16 TaxID=1566248 RepID=UPI0008D5CBCC|nr:hypothetical protein [Pseudomonas sp. NFR16]SEJ06169.1 hypothetical protein SAMN03159495_2164 [Pseudomonas sp. NFR16]
MNQMSSDTSAALFVLRGVSQRYGKGKNAAGMAGETCNGKYCAEGCLAERLRQQGAAKQDD